MRKAKLDFPVGKKKYEPKKPHIIKREVFPTEILPVQNSSTKKTKRGSAKIEASYILMPEFISNGMLAKQVTGFLSLLIIAALIMQTFSYVGGAKKNSGEILGVATSAYSDLTSAGQSLENQDFGSAMSLFQSAQTGLADAVEKLSRYKILTWIVPSARSADHVLEGAEDLALGGEKLAAALALYSQLVVSSEGVETLDFAETLRQSKISLGESLTLLRSASDHFSKADSLPSEYTSQVTEAKLQVDSLVGILSNLVALEDLYLDFFGDQTKTYLLVFQNPDELRATGGFIGTIGVLKISSGQIKQLKIESVYNLDGSLYAQIAAPGPFQPDIRKWGLRDANWFADFPTTASQLLRFYEQGRETADGVIAATPKIFEDLLGLVGPIEMASYGETLTSENFQEVVQRKTSVEYDKALNQPKQFLADFAPVLLDRLSGLSQESWFSVLQIFSQSFSAKDAILYSTDPATQDKIESLGFGGKILAIWEAQKLTLKLSSP
jgi:hypothetical protein